MADKKQSKLGFDPLAWMKEETEDHTDDQKNLHESQLDKKSKNKKKPPEKVEKIKEEKSQQGVDPLLSNEKTLNPTDNQGKEKRKMVSVSQPKEGKTQEKRIKSGEQAVLMAMLKNSKTAFMRVDSHRVITYANKASIKILSEYEDVLQQHYPDFKADYIVGSCIDGFHKDPERVARILADPRMMPHEADIKVGNIIFHLSVDALYDDSGNFEGNSLQWENVTEKRQHEKTILDYTGKIEAISKSQAVIEFNMDGTILTANDNFLNTVGYTLDEIKGKHHSLFVDEDYKSSQEYKQFWEKLNRGEYDVGDYKRIGNNGKKIWIQATYNPILDEKGSPYKVVKYATDITKQMDALSNIENLVADAVAGRLNNRIDTAHYDGFIEKLCSGINQLMDTVVAPVNEANRVMQALSSGDLTQTVDGSFEGDFDKLGVSINGSVETLQGMVMQIREAADTINTAASEISHGNIDLSQRTEEQASSLQETASSMEELTSTVKQNASNARQANQLASGARDQAEKGGSVVTKAVEAMFEINNSSKKIADIIGVIDEIAFQTNLLALNAAVEAARAGEQGRGFAVVATEVRNLAQRSAGAAKEIKSLIKDSVEKVEGGTQLVDESGKTLAQIVKSVKQVSDIVAEIAAASQEQSAGIEEVNKAITQMDEVTQQNAALVEEAAAASESMDEQSRELVKVMGFFTLPTGNNREVQSPVVSLASTQKSAPSNKKVAMATANNSDDEWEEF